MQYKNKIERLSLWRRPTKSSPIFAKLYTACSSWYAELRTFRLFEISLSVLKICEIFVFSFFLMCVLIWKTIFTKITVFILMLMLIADLLEISFTVQKISVTAFTFFNSAWPQCEVFLIKKQLLCLQNFVKWAVVMINHFCFLLQEAEIKSFDIFIFENKMKHST